MKMFQKLAIVAVLFFVGLEAQAMRWYSPSTGRWLSRDPIEERAFKTIYVATLGSRERLKMSRIALSGNEYLFVKNRTLQLVDPFGLYGVSPADPTANCVVCDGKGGMKVQFSNQNAPNLDTCVKACIQIHEQNHIKNYPQDVCKDQPEGVVVGFSNTAEQERDERKAYQAERDCLNKLKGACPLRGCSVADIDYRLREISGMFN